MIRGRSSETAILQRVLDSHDAELVAVYGRRRVGKTHLIREFFEPRCGTYMSVTGEHGARLAQQLHHMRVELERVFYGGAPLPSLRSWADAFDLMASVIERRAEQRPSDTIVVFLDELPWLSTRRSGLIGALDHVWNTRLSRIRQLRLIVCGSAASWMIDKLIRAKGGLYNRVTTRMRLDPFTLAETRDLLCAHGVRWGIKQILELYLAIGGIPHYLKQVTRGRSAIQNVAGLCFDPNGPLRDEFGHLFASLFAHADSHEAIVRGLASKRRGLSRAELMDATGLPSGGRLGRWLRELEEAGFVARFVPYGKKQRDASYRVIDEYASFYLSFIERAPRGSLARGASDYWVNKAQGRAYQAWAGYAFEGVCLKHVPEIRRSLGIEHIASEVGTWRHVPRKASSDNGAQIDLLFDRADGVVTLCEIKYASDKYAITKAYARELAVKADVFKRKTRTKKDIQFALITTHGLATTPWSSSVDAVVDGQALFRPS